MKKLTPYLIGIAIGLFIFFCFFFKGCEGKKEVLKFNVEKIHDYSDSVTAIVKQLNIVRDSIRIDQDIILIQKKVIAQKSKELARIKDLVVKINLVKPDSSQYEKHSQVYIDSLNRVALEKERLLDLCIKYDSSLVATIVGERALQDEKDSLNHNLIVRLNDSLDSLEQQHKRDRKRAVGRAVKIAFGAGTIFGLGVGIVAK